MEWLNEVLGLGASAASGGVFGFLGAIAGQLSKYFQEKQRQSWEREKWGHEERLLQLQMAARAQETEMELAIVAESGSWRGLASSFRAASDPPGYRWVSAVKSCFRPFITLVLWAVSVWVFYQITTSSTPVLTESEVKSLVSYMVYSIFFTACTATAWWFGDRALTPSNFKNK